MHLTVQRSLYPVPIRITRRSQQLALLAALCCLVATTAATPTILLAQPPATPETPTNPEPDPPAPPETVDPVDDIPPEFIDFTTMLNPGSDIWLISGQIVGCEDPSNIGVSIGGVISASAVTDVFGYFEVVVSYEGIRDTITADAEYAGEPLTQAQTQIGG